MAILSTPVLIHSLAIALLAAIDVDIPPVPVSLNIAGQPIAIEISGHVSEAMKLDLRADLSDFQAHLTPLLQAELNREDRCGERISITDATLRPAPPSANLVVHLHVEKWACFKAFGKENAKRLVGGNALVEMKVEMMISPQSAGGTDVHLDGDVGRIEADGSLGELLRSGSLGDSLRNKVRESLLKAVRKATDFNTVVPEQVRPYVAVESLAFEGDTKLALRLVGRLNIPPDRSAILERLRSQP